MYILKKGLQKFIFNTPMIITSTNINDTSCADT